MRLLHAGVDTTVIALWLGHESTQTTQIYLHADLALKERALARTAPPNTARPLPAPRPAARLSGEPVIMRSDLHPPCSRAARPGSPSADSA